MTARLTRPGLLLSGLVALAVAFTAALDSSADVAQRQHFAHVASR